MIRLSLSFALAGLVAVASCAPRAAAPVATTASISATPKQHGVAVADLDRRVNPCDDFFAFASGAWFAANPIPAGEPRWSRRAASREANKKRVQELLAALATKPSPPGSPAQLVGDYYASCTDEASADAAALTPLAPLLAEIDGARTVADIGQAIRRLQDLAIPVPFSLNGGLDYREPHKTVATLGAGAFGMPDRDVYVKPDASFARARETYRAHVARVLALAGMSEVASKEGAAAVLGLETRLAEASLDSIAAADPVATYHPMTFAELDAFAPSVGWPAYFGEAGLPRAGVVVAEPKLLQQIDRELKNTPIAVWQTYLRWHLLATASPWLSKRFVDESEGEGAKVSRASFCAESADALLPDALGKVYVERYFPPAARARVGAVIESMMAVLRDDAAHAEWMQPETRAKALAKLATYSAQLGYPETWEDDAPVTIRRDTLWANVAAARRFGVAENRKQIGKPTDPHLWQLRSSATAFAYLDLQLNEIILPAGFLQWPQFDPGSNDAVVYGAIGAGVAHDMTHGIDESGATIDPAGRPLPWWSDADKTEFTKRSQCVIEQAESFEVEPGVHQDGKRVAAEAIGDLAGIRIAYLAFQKSLTRNPVPVVDGFTPAQQFFVAAAQARSEIVRPEVLRELLKEDPHPASKFRINGTFANEPAFQEAFACKEGAAMVRPPEKRCAVW